MRIGIVVPPFISVPPERTFVTHGEPGAADALRRHLDETLHWRCEVPIYLESAELPGSALEAERHPGESTAMADPVLTDPDQSASHPEVT